MRQLRVFAILTLSAAAASAGLAAAQEAPAPQPKAVVVEAVKDVGLIAKGEKISHDFVIRNEGNADLEITSVKPACGCTVADYDKLIAPGASGRIHTEVETVSFAGPISKGVTVVTNDAANPRLQLTIKADVKPYIGVIPGYARYIYVQGEEAASLVQMVWAETGEDFQVLSASSPYSYLKVAFREASEDERKPEGRGRQWRVEMTLAPDSPVGALKEFVVIKTNHDKQAEVQIPVTGFVRPTIAVTPPAIELGNLELKEPRRFNLALVNHGSAAIEVTKVESDLSGVAGEVRPTEAGRRFQVQVTLPTGMPKGAFSGLVKIHTTSALKPVVEVPVRGTVL